MEADGCDTERSGGYTAGFPTHPGFLYSPFMWPFFAHFAMAQSLSNQPDSPKLGPPMDWSSLQRPQECYAGGVLGIKAVGTLTPAQRREKIMRFLEKRARRNFSKKISYHCRKRVADGRLRIKGRFITSAQAATLSQDPTHM